MVVPLTFETFRNLYIIENDRTRFPSHILLSLPLSHRPRSERCHELTSSNHVISRVSVPLCVHPTNSPFVCFFATSHTASDAHFLQITTNRKWLTFRWRRRKELISPVSCAHRGVKRKGRTTRPEQETQAVTVEKHKHQRQRQVTRKREKHRQEEKETEMKLRAKTCKHRTKQT